MTPGAKLLVNGSLWTPYSLPGNAAIYALDGAESDRSYLTNGSGRVTLVADKSGNSAVNCLVLNGAAGNYATSPDSAAVSVTGDIDIRVGLAMDDWTPSGAQVLVAKEATAGQQSFDFFVNTDGTLGFGHATNGSNNVNRGSTAATGITDLADQWVRVTMDVDNGAAGYDVKFYKSADGTIWTQIGSTVTVSGTTSIFDGPSILEMGAEAGALRLIGKLYRVQIRNNILDDGTGIVFDADFSKAAKLAASFAESSTNAATVTINSSGDFGARICGARDMYDPTSTKMPALSVAGGYNIATFDGSNDFLKAGAFSLSQPTTVYFVGSQVAWTNGKYVHDGNTLDTLLCEQANGISSQLTIYAGSALGNFVDPGLGNRFVIAEVFNGASSSLALNRNAALTGNVGAGNANGFTVGSTPTGGSSSNITFSEVIIRNVADDVATQQRIAAFLIKKWGIAA